MSDLFIETKKLSKKAQVYEFIKSKGRARTSEVIKFGTSIFYNRAERSARDLCNESRIWRVADHIKLAIYNNTKEDVWSIFPADRDYR